MIKKISVMILIIFTTVVIFPPIVWATGGVQNSSFVILRAAPNLNSKPTAVLPFTEKLEVIGQSGDWVQVSCSKGTGYMRRCYLKWSDSNNSGSAVVKTVSPTNNSAIRPSVAVSPTPVKQLDTNVQSGNYRTIKFDKPVYMRLEKSLNSKSPTAITPGASVKIISAENGWCKVEYNGKTGYVRSYYLGLSNNASATPKRIESDRAINFDTRIGDNRIESSNIDSSSNVRSIDKKIKPSRATHTTPPKNVRNNKETHKRVSRDSKDWMKRFSDKKVISDQEFTNYDSMSRDNIQAFLSKKYSCLATSYGGKYPADAIYNAAHKYKINPKIILARLQVEQGLVTKKRVSKHKLDWALGVGCYDSGNWNQAYKGFDKQVAGCAKTFRRWYDYSKNHKKLKVRVDGSTKRVNNAATYALYKYTPHVSAAKLEWKVYRGFFK